jgi:hypothetical protein
MRKHLLLAVMGIAMAMMVSAVGIGAATSGAQDNGYAPDLTTLEGTLNAWTVQALGDLQPRDDGTVVTTVRLGQIDYVLALKPYSMRSIDFTVEKQLDNGQLVEVEPPAPATYRGIIAGVPGSVVAATVFDGQMTAIIDLGEDDLWFVEPLSPYDASALQSEHVVYRGSDTRPTGKVCGTDLIPQRERINRLLKMRALGAPMLCPRIS